ncbi:MAG: hypothetical protein V1668_00900 [Patescibacteria group bacterium]
MDELRITGFDATDDPKIPNEVVRDFLLTTFGADELRRCKFTHIRKIPLYIIFISHRLGNEVRKGINDFLFGSPLRIYRRPNMPSLLFADLIDDYIGLALHLEGKKTPDELEHVYKVRANAGEPRSNEITELGSFGVEQPEWFDYLAGCGVDGHDDLMRVYILGTLAHEIAHRYRDAGTKGWDDDYRLIVREEIAAHLRARYVSDYVMIHERVHNTEPDRIENEDLVEAVRIFLTNPAYLRMHYPRRYEFILTAMPFLVPGSIIEVVKSM